MVTAASAITKNGHTRIIPAGINVEGVGAPKQTAARGMAALRCRHARAPRRYDLPFNFQIPRRSHWGLRKFARLRAIVQKAAAGLQGQRRGTSAVAKPASKKLQTTNDAGPVHRGGGRAGCRHGRPPAHAPVAVLECRRVVTRRAPKAAFVLADVASEGRHRRVVGLRDAAH